MDRNWKEVLQVDTIHVRSYEKRYKVSVSLQIYPEWQSIQNSLYYLFEKYMNLLVTKGYCKS